ncbi:uncharacterized protein LOC130892842 [Diorhabda carinulata]|uniref:uncharacterized protein LOC130892842 n=1 Tax=Diorhabda carinulata TaxID=1163345 RepID=UPI0025A234D0|nr:uncharacterized protein LOC130892842 [Diorhabda carinulata]
MNIRERLQTAYENVMFNADATWSDEFSLYKQANMNLLMREKALQEKKYEELRPRTVRDCIPESRLAKYGNYEYNESRELSYTPDDIRPSTSTEYDFTGEKEKEPWMFDEVDRLFKSYTDAPEPSLNATEELNRIKFSNNFESPFMKCNSLAEYLLKLRITKDSVRRLWEDKSPEPKSSEVHQPTEDEKSVKPPADYDVGYLESDNADRPSAPSSSEVKSSNANQPEPSQNRRSYSAVLQGCVSENKIAPPIQNPMTVLGKKSVANFPRLFPNVSNSRSVQLDNTAGYQNANAAPQSRLFPLRQQSVRYQQNYTPSNYQYPTFHALTYNSSQNYLQPFYNPVFFQRAVPINQTYVRPCTFKSYNSFSSNIHRSENKPCRNKSRKRRDLVQKSRTLSTDNLQTDKKEEETAPNLSDVDSEEARIYKELDELAMRMINSVLDDPITDPIVPITESHSEELERQALEQYNNSNDNVFQDLERQAAEEYDEN